MSRSTAMVHGRFQPFHNGHLELIRAGRERGDRLVVGITDPDPSHRVHERADPARSTPAANPFTYLERAWMVDAVLRAEGVDAVVVPFPISRAELWRDYVPGDTLHVLRVFDAWGAEKVARLRAHGHDVVIVDEGREKEVSGTEVRRRLREDGDWRALVPSPVAAIIDDLPEDRARDLRRPA